MSRPLVSIIILCFNASEYVVEMLDSVTNQTYKNIGIIAIDDGSTDDTLNILYDYQKHMSTLKVISQSNTYCIIVRQNAITHAKGEYLVCLDSDDKLHPSYIEKCIEFAQKEDLDVVYADAQYFDAVNKKWDLPEFKLPDFLHCNCIYITAMIKKSTFDKVGGFDISLTHFEDWDLFISIIKGGGKVGKINEALFFYRQRRNNSSITNLANDRKLSDNVLKIYLKYYEFYMGNNIYFHKMLFRDFLKINQDKSPNSNKHNKLLFNKLKGFLLKE